MDYDDRFHATQNNDVEDDKHMLQDLKQTNDKRYHMRFKRVKMSNNYFKNMKIEMYGSGDSGSTIRDAETGDYYRGHLVGSLDEDLFFKTSFTLSQNQDSLMLYYLSPEHYERHQYIVLNEDIKQKWYQKKNLHLKKQTN